MSSNIFPFVWEDKKCYLEYEYLLSNENNKKLRKFEERCCESNLVTLYIENDKIITFETSVFLVESNIESHYYLLLIYMKVQKCLDYKFYLD